MINYRDLVDISAQEDTCHKMVMQEHYEGADEESCSPNWNKLLHQGGGFNVSILYQHLIQLTYCHIVI
jgi:hypothetical protein